MGSRGPAKYPQSACRAARPPAARIRASTHLMVPTRALRLSHGFMLSLERAGERALSEARAGVEQLRNLGTDWNLAYGFSYECKGRNDVNSTYNIVPLRLVSTLCLGSGPWGGLKRPTKGPPALPGHFWRLLEDEHFTRPIPVSRKRAGITPRDPAQQFKVGGRTPRYERISVVS